MSRTGALVIFRKQLGDLLLLQPALSALSAELGRIEVFARDGFADLLSLMPGDIHPATKAWFPQAKHVYCLEARPATLIYAARIRAGKKSLLLTRNDAPFWQSLIFDQYRIEPGAKHYRAELYYRMLCNRRDGFTPPRLQAPPSEWLPPGLPSAYRVVHPTAAWRRKTWSPAHWVETLLALDSPVPWVLTSGPSEWEIELVGEIHRQLPSDKALNLAGKTSLRQFLAVMAGCQAALCVDGSASHLAAAFGHPTLTLFGPTDARRWHFASATTPCLCATDFSPENKPPVDAIPVAKVIDLAQALMAQTEAAR